MDSSLYDFSAKCTERHLVDSDLLKRDWPLAYTVAYTAQGALQNISYLENGLRHFNASVPIRCFFSSWTAAVVASFVPLDAVRDPHIREWYSTYFEVPIEEAKRRLAAHPEWPYDGRTTLQAREDLRNQTASAQITRSQKMLRARGLDLTRD